MNLTNLIMKHAQCTWGDDSMCREARKPVFGASDQVRHKPAYAATEDGRKLKILDLGRRGIVLFCSENKGADQLCSYCTADLRLCFRIGKIPVFSKRGSYHIMFIFRGKSFLVTRNYRRVLLMLIFYAFLGEF